MSDNAALRHATRSGCLVNDSVIRASPSPNSQTGRVVSSPDRGLLATRNDAGATPTRASFELGSTDDNDENDEVDDDEEFESHYSRQESPMTSSESDNDEEHDNTSDSRVTNGQSSELSPVHRVSSMPIHSQIYQHMLHNRLHSSQSTTSLPLSRTAPPIPPPLYPPFYNRPPTPLPPSPSFTSLLRPPSLLNRSTASTRPTTPDSSDVETPNDTEAAVAHSARRATPLPPTAPRVPTYEYYGFVLYLASTLVFIIYILWSYLPSPFLHALGITYYPNRWWSLAIPAWIVMLLVYIYIALACYNTEYLTLRLSQLETTVDDAGNIAILDESGRIRKGGSKKWVAELEERKRYDTAQRRKKGARRERHRNRRERDSKEDCFGYNGEIVAGGVAAGLTWRQIWNEGTDAVMDIPLGGVCEVLYGEGRDVP